MIDALSLANAAAWFAQVACVVALGAMLPPLLRLQAPDAAYMFWRTLLAFCLALPWLQGRATPEITPALDAVVTDTTVAVAASAATAPAVRHVDWWTIAVWLVAAGTIARLLWVAVGLARLRRLRTAGNPPADTTDQDELQRILGTRAEIRYVENLRHPVTFGVLRPVVLLPSAVLDRPAEILRAVLAHELLHVHRRDWAWLLVEECVRAILWFHPAIWWLISRVQLAREEVVDEMAVAITGRRRTYVEALLAFADRVPLTPAPAFARHRHLFRRIVVVSREASMSSKRIVASGAVMALAVVVGSWYAVGAFPLLAQARGALVQVMGTPGPIESHANPVTPENPMPRRIGYVDPIFPADMPQVAGGHIHVRATVDASGRVVEARATAAYRLKGRQFITVDASTLGAWQPWMRAAAEAVSQWQYDTPFQAPLAFDVVVAFGEAAPPPPPPPPPPAPAQRSGGRPRVAPLPPPPPPQPAGAVQKSPGMPPPPPPPPPPARGVPGGVVGGVPGGVAGASDEPTVDSSGAYRIGGRVPPPTKIKDVRPVYPPEAQAAKVQGVVIIEARIDEDGTVSEARVLRSVPVLDQAAIDAVRQWQFTPTVIEGKAVPVIMTVTVNFKLGRVQGGVVGGIVGGVVGGIVGGVPGGVSGGVDSTGAIRVGGYIRPPTKTKDVRPVYPEIAQAAKVQGVVIVEARIEAGGTVSDVRILRSIPLLDQAAIDAVRQWEFRPTLHNGVPTPVIATMTVNFRVD